MCEHYVLTRPSAHSYQRPRSCHHMICPRSSVHSYELCTSCTYVVHHLFRENQRQDSTHEATRKTCTILLYRLLCSFIEFNSILHHDILLNSRSVVTRFNVAAIYPIRALLISSIYYYGGPKPAAASTSSTESKQWWFPRGPILKATQVD
jgi:hypothetical protein